MAETHKQSSQLRDEILRHIPTFEKVVKEQRDLLLANLVMIGEIPAPTFQETDRLEFVKNRFTEANLQNCSTDEVGNTVGLLPGKKSERTILMVAHSDTVFSEKVDHTISVGPEKIIGPGVADNSLGLAVLSTIPAFLDSLNIELDSDLLLMGTTRSLGQGNLEGLRFFLSNSTIPIHAGVSIEGAQLGRLSYSSVGMLRGVITCTVPEEEDLLRMTDTNAIITINEVINKIIDIRLPKRPRTYIIMGAINAGHSYNTAATKATLQFEVRSETAEIVRQIRDQLEEIVAEVSSQSGMFVKLDIVATRRPGGIRFKHPLSRVTRKIMKTMEIEPEIRPSISELSAFIAHDIPAVTLGISKAEHIHEPNESVFIDPMYKGISQLIGILMAIDKGYCDEN